MPHQLGSKFSTPGESPGFLLWCVTNRWQRALRAALAPLELTHVQFVLLASIGWLSEGQERVSQIGVARHAFLDPMMTSQVVRALERRGLITRTTNVADQREILLALTTEGLKLMRKALKVVEEADQKFFEPARKHSSELLHSLQQLLAAEE